MDDVQSSPPIALRCPPTLMASIITCLTLASLCLLKTPNRSVRYGFARYAMYAVER